MKSSKPITASEVKWRQELVVIEGKIKDVTIELKKTQDYSDHTYGDSYRARALNANKFKLKIKSLDNMRKYRMNKLAELLAGPPRHFDIFGQEFKAGCRVAWSSSARYAGAQLGTVTGVTPQMVRVSQLRSWRPDDGSNIWPKNLIIVDKLIEGGGHP